MYAPTQHERRVLRRLALDGAWVSARAIADRLELPYSRVNRALLNLTVRDWCEVEWVNGMGGDQQYRLTPLGRDKMRKVQRKSKARKEG